MLVPVPDVPDPLWAPAVDVVSRAAPSAAIASIFMSVPPVERVEMKAHGFIAAAQTFTVMFLFSSNGVSEDATEDFSFCTISSVMPISTSVSRR